MLMLLPRMSVLVRLALVAALLAMVAACTDPVATDYREKFALSAHPTTVVFGIHMAGARIAFAGDEETQFNSLVASYLDRGHGPLTISAPSGPDSKLPPALSAVRARLIAAGVPARDIHMTVTSEGSADTVTMSYERYEAALPTCGDWTSVPSFNPYNDVSSNFGCALQRDIGLMAADPADLVRARPAAPADAQNAGHVVQKYRAGAPTGSVPNPMQSYGNSENQTTGQ